MKVGQVFNPYKTFYGSVVPNCLMRYSNLSPSAKLLWGRLAQFNGKNGKCYPSVKTLSEELGISKRQITRLLNELEDKHFIIRQRQQMDGRYSSNHYLFLWHECFETKIADVDVSRGGDTDVPKSSGTNVPQIDSGRKESLKCVDEHSSSTNPSLCVTTESTPIKKTTDKENDPLAKSKENCVLPHNEKRKAGTSASRQKDSDIMQIRVAHEKFWKSIYPAGIYPEWTGKDIRVAKTLITKLTSAIRVVQLIDYISARWRELNNKWGVDGPTLEVILSYGAGLIGEMDKYNASIKRTQDNRINQRINPEELAHEFKRKG